MENFKKRITYEKPDCHANVDILFENKRLTISASLYEGFSYSTGGQCYEELFNEFPQSARLVEIWRRWHLNDMNAGDAEQETFLRVKRSLSKASYDYGVSRAELERAGLLTHNGYEYGTSWVFEAVPESVLTELKEIKGVKLNKFIKKEADLTPTS